MDTKGAEQLIGMGDMLISTGNDLTRLQCAFIDTPEVEKICDFIGSQRGYANAHNLPEYVGDSESSAAQVDLDDKEFHNSSKKRKKSRKKKNRSKYRFGGKNKRKN